MDLSGSSTPNGIRRKWRQCARNCRGRPRRTEMNSVSGESNQKTRWILLFDISPKIETDLIWWETGEQSDFFFVFPRLFHDAGKELAMLVTALADKATASEDRHLSVLCIGSVWDSWDLLKAGFLSKLREKVPKHVRKVSTTRRRSIEKLRGNFGICNFKS